MMINSQVTLLAELQLLTGKHYKVTKLTVMNIMIFSHFFFLSIAEFIQLRVVRIFIKQDVFKN